MAPDSTQQASLAELKRQELEDARFRVSVFLAAHKERQDLDEIEVFEQAGMSITLNASDLHSIMEALPND